jgi:hypothetical protein
MEDEDDLKYRQLVFGKHLGPPPVLSTESIEIYKEWRSRLILSLRAQNFLEKIFVKQVLDETWKIFRYQRHQSLVVERRFRQSLEFLVKRKNEQKERRREIAKNIAEKSGRPILELQRLIDLEDVVESSVKDVDDILTRPLPSLTTTVHWRQASLFRSNWTG